MTKLLGYQQGVLDNPLSGLQPIKTAAMESVNRNYAGAPDRIQTALSRRGYGSSGKLPAGLYGLESSRLSDLGGLESKFAEIGSNRQTEAGDSIARIIASMRGSTSTGTTPGNMAGAGLSAAGSSLGSLSALMTIQQMLRGGGGGMGSGGYDPGAGGYDPFGPGQNGDYNPYTP